MGSVAFQIQAVAEIWFLEVGSFPAVFGNLWENREKWLNLNPSSWRKSLENGCNERRRQLTIKREAPSWTRGSLATLPFDFSPFFWILSPIFPNFIFFLPIRVSGMVELVCLFVTGEVGLSQGAPNVGFSSWFDRLGAPLLVANFFASLSCDRHHLTANYPTLWSLAATSFGSSQLLSQ